MRFPGKKIAMGWLIALAAACGSPATEPEEKSSPGFGSCPNFQGHWTDSCDQSTFFLVQKDCELFTIDARELNFTADAIRWSDTRDAVTLRGPFAENIVLKKGSGGREGKWISGPQICTLSWAP